MNIGKLTIIDENGRETTWQSPFNRRITATHVRDKRSLNRIMAVWVRWIRKPELEHYGGSLAATQGLSGLRARLCSWPARG